MSAARRVRIGALALLVLALVPRLVHLAQYEAGHPGAELLAIDERAYDAWARELAAGDWLGDEVFFQEPLYPYFLGVVYAAAGAERGPRAARLVQCVLGALACLLVAAAARRLFGDVAGLLAGLGFALLDTAIALPSWLLKPNLLLPLLAGLLLLLLRAGEREAPRLRTWLGVGILAGLGALLRGNLLVLLPLLVGWCGLRAGVRGLAACLGGALLVLAPVALRNLAVGGVLALTTSGAGTNLYGGNVLDNELGTAREFDFVRGIPEREAGDWRREAERRTGRELDPGEVSRYWAGELGRSVAREPLAHLALLANKLRATLSDYEVPDNHDLAWDARHVGVLRAPLASWGLLGPLVLAGVLTALVRPRSANERRLAWLWLAYLATIVLTVTSMRARLPLVPLGLPLAAGFLVRLARELPRPRRAGALGGLSLALLLGVALVHLAGPFDADERARRLDVRDYNLATALVERAPAEARRLAEELAERRPDSARVRCLVAELDARAGLEEAFADAPDVRETARVRVRAALDTLRDVAEAPGTRAVDRHRARRLAGWVQLRLGNGPAAANHFERALEFDDEDPELWLGWIQAALLVLEARPDDATRERLRGEILDAIELRLEPGSDAARDLARRAREG